MGTRRRVVAPLPLRDGVDATRVVVRQDHPSLIAALLATPTLADLTKAALLDRFAAGEVVDPDGQALSPGSSAPVGRRVYLYRDLPDEVAVPFDLPILHVDDDIVVVDKPHFLSTMPRGTHVVETALVRLRRQLGSATVSPAHRLDRLTAGVLLFTLRPEVRGAYQRLFADRLVDKVYRAAAPPPTVSVPLDIADRIVKDARDPRARVVDGEINARSRIELAYAERPGSRDADLVEYRLTPHTGRTHQLRLHMATIGSPIDNDPLYPEIRPEVAELPDRGDFSRPLRLVAAELAFVDPLSGRPRSFVSERPVLGA